MPIKRPISPKSLQRVLVEDHPQRLAGLCCGGLWHDALSPDPRISCSGAAQPREEERRFGQLGLGDALRGVPPAGKNAGASEAFLPV